MKKYNYLPSGRKLKPGTETELAIFIQSHCVKQDPMFYIEPNLEDLKVKIENKLQEMPRKSVAAPWQMFSLHVQQHKPRVLWVQKVSGSKSEHWCSVSIVDQD